MRLYFIRKHRNIEVKYQGIVRRALTSARNQQPHQVLEGGAVVVSDLDGSGQVQVGIIKQSDQGTCKVCSLVSSTECLLPLGLHIVVHELDPPALAKDDQSEQVKRVCQGLETQCQVVDI